MHVGIEQYQQFLVEILRGFTLHAASFKKDAA
jgi:hypothetical protein